MSRDWTPEEIEQFEAARTWRLSERDFKPLDDYYSSLPQKERDDLDLALWVVHLALEHIGWRDISDSLGCVWSSLGWAEGVDPDAEEQPWDLPPGQFIADICRDDWNESGRAELFETFQAKWYAEREEYLPDELKNGQWRNVA